MFDKYCNQNMDVNRVDGQYLYFSHGDGPYLFDKAGKTYIDFFNGFGSVILGYGDEDIKDNIMNAVNDNSLFIKCPTTIIDDLCKEILEDYPGDKRIGIYTTGTAAVLAAVEVARQYTGKNLIISSGYHGWDSMWDQGERPFEANKQGVIDFYFILEKLEELIIENKNKIAAVIVSPDLTYFDEEYYKKLNKICKKNNLMIILDDVKLGYRYNIGASIKPQVLEANISIISKCISNGSKISVVVGEREIMNSIEKQCYTSFFDNYSFISALTTIRKIKKQNVQDVINCNGNRFIEMCRKLFKENQMDIRIYGNGNLFQFVFPNDEISNKFYSIAIKEGLIFFEGDNQCISFAFDDGALNMAEIRMKKVVNQLSAYYSKDFKISEERIFETSFQQIDGCMQNASLEYKIQFVKKLYEKSQL